MKSFPVFIRIFIILLIALVSLEVLARLSVRPGPRFRLDSELGWVSREVGVERTASQEGVHKTLVLGDSFIFGEGVTNEQRFDRVMHDQGYRDTIINLGMSGYSTDQELMAAQKELNTLQAGDSVVLATFGDDFRGLLSDVFAGRAKSKFRIESERLVLIKPKIKWASRILDRFYLAAGAHKIFRSNTVAQEVFDRKALDEALELYEALLFQYLVPVKEQKINVIIAFHGKKIVDEDFGMGAGDEAERYLQSLCDKYKFMYLSLDPELDSPDYRQPKSVHWNAQGHHKFADFLMSACDNSSNQLHLSQKESR